MGMAASQARYLALVARKSNCEYEGQQINQARTALSNQSANLFNQMLGLNVPVPPSTQDYTKTQYSFTDGINAYTIDNWNQLATPEEEYNYAVTYHYETDVYTGAQKQMSDPQVQFSEGLQAPAETIASALKSVTATRIEYDKIAEEYEKLEENVAAAEKANLDAIAAYEAAVKAQADARTAQEEAQEDLSTKQTTYNNYTTTDPYISAKGKIDGEGAGDLKTALDTANKNLKTLSNYTNNPQTLTETTTRSKDGLNFTFDTVTYKNYSDTSITQEQRTSIQETVNQLIKNGALDPAFNLNDVYFDGTQIAFKNELDKAFANPSVLTVPRYTLGGDDVENSVLAKSKDLTDAQKTAQTNYDSAAYAFSILEQQAILYDADLKQAQAVYDNANIVLQDANDKVVAAASAKLTAEANLTKANNELQLAEQTHGAIVGAYKLASAELANYQIPSFIGNCELTLLENLTSDQEAELKQVVADMSKLEKQPAICNCFSKEGKYLGGIFQFKLNGTTYYACFDDLYNSYESGTGINHIDGQTKLSHYNASYVPTKIEETQKALLQTDEYGRFVSVRFDDDSINYTLKMETVTDDVAYEDAMNKYYYENAVYDKMVQDINAKTSIIQHEDQQLELRLKQLDTEQNALSTEMEAVQKVVKDNVDKSFKTFGG